MSVWRRLQGRLFYLVVAIGLVPLRTWAQGPATTTVAEVRWSDAGWGPSNDRNLVGRFSTQTFTVVRLTKSQTIYLRAFDNSFPARYSRFSAALHVDYPA